MQAGTQYQCRINLNATFKVAVLNDYLTTEDQAPLQSAKSVSFLLNYIGERGGRRLVIHRSIEGSNEAGFLKNAGRCVQMKFFGMSTRNFCEVR